MSWPSRSRISPIGLDLGAHSFKAVQIKRGGKHWELLNSLSLPRLSPGSTLEKAELIRLRGVLDRHGFSGNNVVLSIPSGKLYTAMLELPPRGPGVPIEQIAALEFARVHKKEMNQITMSTWELPAPARASKATYLLGVGASIEDLERHIDLVESASLNVVAVEEPHSAAARGCLHLADGTTGLIGIVDLGWTAATLVILMNGIIIYTRKLGDGGMAAICKQAAKTASIDESAAQEEIWRVGFDSALQAGLDTIDTLDTIEACLSAIIKEVQQAFSYASHRYSDLTIGRTILIGGGAAIPGILQRFESMLSVTTCTGTINGSTSPRDLTPALSSALGLAMWNEEGR